MSLKISLFDKSTVKADLRRFWWVSALYILACAITFLPDAAYIYTNVRITEFQYNSDQGIFAFCAAFFMAGIMFSYLNKASSVSCMHGVPVTKGQQYLSHILSGILLIILPVLLCGGIIAAESVYIGGSWHYAVKFIYTSCMYSMLGFFFTVVATMISGNTIAAYIFSFGFMILPAYVIYVFEYICSKYIYGYCYSIDEIIQKLYIVGINYMWSINSIWYIVLIIVLAVIGYIAYIYRPLENYDEIVTFKWLRPVFMYVVAICFGFFGCAILEDLLEFNELFVSMLPLGIAAIIATNMLIHKSLNIRGAVKHIVIYIALVGVMRLSLLYDITGFEHRVPELNEVESVSFEPENTHYEFNTVEDYEPMYADVVPVERFTDEKNISNMINLHKAIVAYGRKSDDYMGEENDYIYDDTYTGVYIEYRLKNGATLKRCYSGVSQKEYSDYLIQLYESDKYKWEKYALLRHGDDLRIVEAKYNNVMYWGGSRNLKEYNIDNDKLLEALRADLNSLTYEQMIYTEKCDTGYYLDLTLMTTVDGNEYSGNDTISLNKYFTKTRALLTAVEESSSSCLLNTDRVTGGNLEVYYRGDAVVNKIDIDRTNAIRIADLISDMDYKGSTEEDVDKLYRVELNLKLDSGDIFNIGVYKPSSELPNDIMQYIGAID